MDAGDDVGRGRGSEQCAVLVLLCILNIVPTILYLQLTFKFSIVSSGSLPSISVPSTPAARTASAYRCDASADEHRSDASHVATSSTLLLCVIKG